MSRWWMALPICFLSLACMAVEPLAHVTNEFVQGAFGATCSVDGAPPPLTADLDGDGVEDIVIVARCKNPMIDEAEHNFKVIDPFNSYFGYSDPRTTSQFASEDPANKGAVLLIIHGDGPDAWRSATPKAKFVVINLPFKQISLRKFALKKKVIMAIFAEETGGDEINSSLFWDGKKYRYVPLGAGLE